MGDSPGFLVWLNGNNIRYGLNFVKEEVEWPARLASRLNLGRSGSGRVDKATQKKFCQLVMPAPAAGIHAPCDSPIAWMPGTSPGMTVARWCLHPVRAMKRAVIASSVG